jgi:cytochrome c-type biogenesis protein CcmE
MGADCQANEGSMNPERRRRIRLTAALSAALVLAGALAYTSFSAAAEVSSPSQLASAVRGRTYRVTGTVLPGYSRAGAQLVFRLVDRSGTSRHAVLIRYTGAVPDPFRAGREVIVTVVKADSAFIGQPNSLITKCPSKFATAPGGASSSQPRG